MEREMKKYLLAAGVGFAQCTSTICLNESRTRSVWNKRSEWIYSCPSITDTYFAFIFDPAERTPKNDGIYFQRKYNNNPSYTSGYRIEGIYALTCVNDIRFRWTQLPQQSHSETLSTAGTDLSIAYIELPPSDANFGHPGPFANSTFDGLLIPEALLGQLVYDCSPFALELALGVQYGHVKFSEALLYESDVPEEFVNLTFQDTFNGVGPEVTFDADYSVYTSDFCCNPASFNITSSLRSALLIGNSRARQTFTPTDETTTPPSTHTLITPDSKSWRVVPWLDLKAGLSYTSNCDCIIVSVEAGYEAGSYFTPLSKEIFPFDGGFSFSHFQNFTYHGPYAAVAVMF